MPKKFPILANPPPQLLSLPATARTSAGVTPLPRLLASVCASDRCAFTKLLTFFEQGPLFAGFCGPPLLLSLALSPAGHLSVYTSSISSFRVQVLGKSPRTRIRLHLGSEVPSLTNTS